MPRTVENYAYACINAECGFYKVMNNGPTSAHFKPGSPIFAHPNRCGAQLYVITNPIPEAEWKTYTDTVTTLRNVMEKVEKPPIYLQASADYIQELLNEWFADAEPFHPSLPSAFGGSKDHLRKLEGV